MKNIIFAIGISYLIVGVCGTDNNCLPNNIIYPNGDWTLTAKNPKINGNLLCAELKNSNGKYESSCIVFNQNDRYFNIDGKFAKVSNKIPDGEWLTYTHYKKESVHFRNGRLCAKLLMYKDDWVEDCIYVGEGDRIGISYWKGFYRY
jgi:hypothetical protein